MVEDEILQNFLSNAVKNAKKQIEEEGKLTVENAIPLLLQSQFNHIIHLDYELSNLRRIIDERFEKVDERFEKMEGRFEQINKKIGWIFGLLVGLIGLGFTYIGSLIAIIKYVK